MKIFITSGKNLHHNETDTKKQIFKMQKVRKRNTRTICIVLILGSNGNAIGQFWLYKFVFSVRSKVDYTMQMQGLFKLCHVHVCSISYASHTVDETPVSQTRPRGYKTFFVLNSVEHEILNAHKYKNIKKFSLFKAQLSLECYFSRSYMLKCQQLLAF